MKQTLRMSTRLVVSLAIWLVASGCGPSEDDCRPACEAAASACTDPEVVEKCVERCQEEADQEQIDYAAANCGDYDVCSWGLCCSGFYYDEAGKMRNCE